MTRLATYLRVLGVMSECGTIIVSSEELAAAAGVGSAKLRKDLSFLGPNGVRGVGYDVARLRSRIERALGLDRGTSVVLVGVGNLGRALAGYGGFGASRVHDGRLVRHRPGSSVRRSAASACVHVDGLQPACDELTPTIASSRRPTRPRRNLRPARARRTALHSELLADSLDAPDHVEVRRVDLAVEMQMLSFSSARKR